MKKLLLLPLIIFSFLVKAQEYPDYKWSYVNDPVAMGWDTAKLNVLHRFLIDSTHVTGLMIVQNEKVIFEYGDVQENSVIASCRKSILVMLYGEYVRSGEIDLNKSLKELNLDDKGGLLPAEKEATVRDIISARSGVFHPAGYLGDYLYLAPPRGSVKPGSYWLYSNWDFNVAGFLFEKLTHKDIYDEVDKKLAIPLHMQDWDRSLQNKEGDTSKSIYLGYPMWFSTRDMARIGQLMLNNGKWAGKQLIDANWIKEMLTPRTTAEEVKAHRPDYNDIRFNFGYGYMWWLWLQNGDKHLSNAYSAFGNMGQSISVFPEINTVIIYKTKAAYERETPLNARYRLLKLAVDAVIDPH